MVKIKLFKDQRSLISSKKSLSLRIGKYKHYKGKLYNVVGVAKHSETLEDVVVYQALYNSKFGKNALWVRPRKMFDEHVRVDGKLVPRFRFIE